jgi:hypothetical protein
MDDDRKTDSHRNEQEEETEGERHVSTLQKFIGFVLIVLAWLQLLVAVSSGSDADYMPFIYYFLGLVIFMSGSIASWYKYPVMAAASLIGLTLVYHIKSVGSAMRWEKELVVYGTILYVVVYLLMAKKPAQRMTQPPEPPPQA